MNISARNLADGEFAKKVQVLLDRHNVAADLLEVEVTGSAVMLDPEQSAQILHELHVIGVRIAIDDFGAGSPAWRN